MGAVKKLGEIFNVFLPPLRSKIQGKILDAASSGSTSDLTMKLKNGMELPDVAVRQPLEYKMRSRSSNSSIPYTTVPPFKTLAASPMCAALSPKGPDLHEHEKCAPEIKSLTQ